MKFKDFKQKSFKELELEYGQENLFQFLFPEKIELNKYYKNPTREDSNNGCSFVWMNNTLTFRDWSKGKNYNYIEFGMTYFKFQLKDLLDYLNTKFNPINFKTTNINKKEYKKAITDIQIKTKDFTEEELEDFHTYDFKVDGDFLNKCNIYSVKTLYYNGEVIQENCNRIYAFVNIDFKGIKKYQIYFPSKEKSKRYRSVSTDNIPQLQYLKHDCKKLIITKSNMDSFYIRHVLGINSIAVLNEGVVIPEQYMNILDKKYELYLLFDNDKAGRQAVIKYKKQYPHIKFNVLFIPFKYGKDIKDVIKKYKVNDIKQVFKKKMKY